MRSTKDTTFIQAHRATCLEIHSHQTSKTPTLHQSVKSGDEPVTGKVRMTKGGGWLKFDIVCFTEGTTKPRKTRPTLRSGLSKAATAKNWSKLQDSFSDLSLAWSLARKSGGLSSQQDARLEQSLDGADACSETRGKGLKKDGIIWYKDGCQTLSTWRS